MKLTPDQQAGLYITVSIHLAVIIVLLAARIGFEVQRENSFVMDFTAQEEVERLQQRIRMQERVEAQLEQMLSDQGVPVRNVTVDQSTLKDDRGTNAEELYKEAERLAKELQEGQHKEAEPAEVKSDMGRRRDDALFCSDFFVHDNLLYDCISPPLREGEQHAIGMLLRR